MEVEDQVYGNIWRKGAKILSINCKIRTKKKTYEPPILQPRLQLKVIPSANGLGEDVKKIIRIPVVGWLPHEAAMIKNGEATVSFERSEADPLYKLMPIRVLAGVYAIGSFTLNYGEEIADLRN